MAIQCILYPSELLSLSGRALPPVCMGMRTCHGLGPQRQRGRQHFRHLFESCWHSMKEKTVLGSASEDNCCECHSGFSVPFKVKCASWIMDVVWISSNKKLLICLSSPSYHNNHLFKSTTTIIVVNDCLEILFDKRFIYLGGCALSTFQKEQEENIA